MKREGEKIKEAIPVYRNERGVALLIVLLVTALLIALIFEFSYGTRISLNNAINYRDSQRAYYLARSGIYAFMKYGDLRTQIPQGEWGTVPIISDGDTQVLIKWEDESGKIKINDVKTDQTMQAIVKRLFENKGIATSVLDGILDQQASKVNSTMNLLSWLHQYMNDEDFSKVAGSLTVSRTTAYPINVNTAPLDVLESLGIGQGAAELIIQERQKNPYKDIASVPGISNLQVNGTNVAINLLNVNTNNTIYTVYAYATVGGYTKQIQAILNGSTITYWRAL